MGGSRILQAIARDKIFPFISWAGRGFGSGDEPRLAMLLTGAIAQAAMFIGGLDTIAPIITTFFCMSYALVNLSLLLVSMAGTPNFRPRFKYWHWTTALAGFLSNFFIMWVLSWMYALIACGIFALIVVLLSFSDANKRLAWGDIRMALIFHQIRKFLLRLNPREQHGKLWRPSVLLFVSNVRSPLLKVCNYLKRGGIYVVGDVLLASHIDDVSRKQLEAKESEWLDVVADQHIKAFSQVLVAPNARFGYHNLMTTAGLGALSLNTVALPMWDANANDTACDTVAEYVHVMRDAAALGKNVVVACNFDNVDAGELFTAGSLFRPRPQAFMDLFVLPHEKVDSWHDFELGPLGSLTLMFGLQNRKLRSRLVRAAMLVSQDGLLAEREKMVDIVKRNGRFRLGKKGKEIHVVSALEPEGVMPSFDDKAYFEVANQLIQHHRGINSCLLFLAMPNLNAEPQTWLEHTQTLVRGLGPTLLVLTSREQQIMTLKI